MRGWILIALAVWAVVEFFVYWWLTYSHDQRARRIRALSGPQS